MSNDYNKFLVKTEAEINSLSAIFQGGDLELPSLGGKSMSDIFGKQKVYNVNYFYTIADLENHLITNEEHADYGKYYLAVSPADVTAHMSSELSNLVDYDPTWVS